jgi:hypothetical protein
VPQETMRWTVFEVRGCEYRVPLAKAIANGDTAAAEARARSDLRDMLVRFRRRNALEDDTGKVALPALAVGKSSKL